MKGNFKDRITDCIVRIAHLAPAGLMVLVVSCSKGAEYSEAPKPAAEIRQEGDKTIVTDITTGSRLVFGATDLPEEFPRDLPVLPEAQMRTHATLSSTIFTTFFSEQPFDELKSYFLEDPRLQEQGWQIDKTEQQQLTFVIDMHKGNRRAMINLKPTRNPDGTSISYVAKMVEE